MNQVRIPVNGAVYRTNIQMKRAFTYLLTTRAWNLVHPGIIPPHQAPPLGQQRAPHPALQDQASQNDGAVIYEDLLTNTMEYLANPLHRHTRFLPRLPFIKTLDRAMLTVSEKMLQNRILQGTRPEEIAIMLDNLDIYNFAPSRLNPGDVVYREFVDETISRHDWDRSMDRQVLLTYVGNSNNFPAMLRATLTLPVNASANAGTINAGPGSLDAGQANKGLENARPGNTRLGNATPGNGEQSVVHPDVSNARRVIDLSCDRASEGEHSLVESGNGESLSQPTPARPEPNPIRDARQRAALKTFTTQTPVQKAPSRGSKADLTPIGQPTTQASRGGGQAPPQAASVRDPRPTYSDPRTPSRPKGQAPHTPRTPVNQGPRTTQHAPSSAPQNPQHPRTSIRPQPIQVSGPVYASRLSNQTSNPRTSTTQRALRPVPFPMPGQPVRPLPQTPQHASALAPQTLGQPQSGPSSNKRTRNGDLKNGPASGGSASGSVSRTGAGSSAGGARSTHGADGATSPAGPRGSGNATRGGRGGSAPKSKDDDNELKYTPLSDAAATKRHKGSK